MTTKVLVCANHGESGATYVRVLVKSSTGELEVDPSRTVELTGPMKGLEMYLPDGGQITVSET